MFYTSRGTIDEVAEIWNIKILIHIHVLIKPNKLIIVFVEHL